MVFGRTQLSEPEHDCRDEEEEKEPNQSQNDSKEFRLQSCKESETENLNACFIAKKVINFRSKADISRFKKLDKRVETNNSNSNPTNKFAEANFSPELNQSISFADPEMVEVELQC